MKSLFLSVLLLSILFSSCKKDADPTTNTLTPVTAKIATVKDVYDDDTSFYQLFYNSDGSLDSMIQTQTSGYERTYKVAYQPGYVLFKQLEYTIGYPQPTAITDSIRLTRSGKPDTVFSFRRGVADGLEAFSYNTAGEIQQIMYFRANGQSNGTTKFYWEAGNLVRGEEAGILFSYQYDLTQASQPGEPLLWYMRMTNGVPYFANRNLATSLQIFGEAAIPYRYTWANGLVRSVAYTEFGDTYYREYTYY